MRYFVSEECALKRLEKPCIYNIKKDELFELDGEGFEFLRQCAAKGGCETDSSNEFLDYCISEGILKTGEVHKGGRESLLTGHADPEAFRFSPSLRYLELQITRRCNLRCRHCYIGPPSDTELALPDIKSILDEFQKMQGLRLIITGGEPLLHRDFDKMNSALPDYALRKILLTNGTLMTERLLERLNVDEIQVSLDGLEKAHDCIRGSGTYRKTLRCIESALCRGFEVSVSTMVHSENLGDFDEMENIFKSLGIKDWNVDVPCLEGNLKDNPLLHLPPETAGRYLGYGFGEGLHGGGSGDGLSDGFACGLHLMSVMADGRCAKCAFYEKEPVGHIREGLANCWQRIGHISLKELECDCDELEACRGGCRYRASILGSHLGKDLYKCFLYDRIDL
jgi:radical SAM protein with 4Fe4S-binding SPASM domain